jgi:hypothetical protein
VLPQHEDGVPVVAERLVERLAEHRPERPQVPVPDVQGQVAARGRGVERAGEEPERLAREPSGRAGVGHAPGGRGLDLGERRAACGDNPHAHTVAGEQVRLRDDRGHAVCPAQVLRVGVDGEAGVVALADELPQRGLVAAVHVDGDRRVVPGVRHQAAVEDVEDVAAAARRECRRSSDGEDREREEGGEDELPSHDDSLGREAWKVRRIVTARCQAAVSRS